MQTIAIVGTGVAGMGAAYFLREKYDITFYEKNDYPGGHTNTLTIDEEGTPVYIDSGFIVYNETTYPNLTRFFKELKVATKPTSMSFSVQHVPSGLEYCGTGLSGLFAQRQNMFHPKFVGMLLEISRFHKDAAEVLEQPQYLNFTVAEYVRERKYSDDFVEKFLLPMSSAVWSAPGDQMLAFPIVTLVRFFVNHCFLGLEGHLPWRTVVDGSQQYREKVLNLFKGKVWTNCGAVKIVRQDKKVLVTDSRGTTLSYDKVIFACHADEVLPLLAEPKPLEVELLKEFLYQPNQATLHTDERVMPKNKRAWSSWNYRIDMGLDGKSKTTTIYDMNSLQGVSQKRNYFISINDPGLIDPKTILWQTQYMHPLYTVAGMKSQSRLPELNQGGPVYFCGSYFNYGFHEDALTSGLNVARAITREKIWP